MWLAVLTRYVSPTVPQKLELYAVGTDRLVQERTPCLRPSQSRTPVCSEESRTVEPLLTAFEIASEQRRDPQEGEENAALALYEAAYEVGWLDRSAEFVTLAQMLLGVRTHNSRS